MLMFAKLALIAMFAAISFSASAETCYYRYGGDYTKNEAEARGWRDAGDEVIRQACGVSPPMVPPRAMKPGHTSSTSHSARQSNVQYGRHPACTEEENFANPIALVNNHTGNIHCFPSGDNPKGVVFVQAPHTVYQPDTLRLKLKPQGCAPGSVHVGHNPNGSLRCEWRQPQHYAQQPTYQRQPSQFDATSAILGGVAGYFIGRRN